jgi:hypothetical protein
MPPKVCVWNFWITFHFQHSTGTGSLHFLQLHRVFLLTLYNWICAYINGIVVLTEGLDMFRLGAVAAGGRMTPSCILSFAKRNLFGRMSGSWTQKLWECFDWRPLWDLGGESLWLKASMIGDKWALPLLNYTLAFALQLRKSTENLSQDRRIVLDINRCINLAALLGVASTSLLSISLFS